ncbi:FtsQ-type POTRA domain-containing protein [Streptomyces sp. NPDC089799]|uniref:cell division protein FtsQ/DivIB n=1 Tax=Streptomyces sp. NPDC089799 TaxID=3155066 RepID=UPI00341D2E0C
MAGPTKQPKAPQPAGAPKQPKPKKSGPAPRGPGAGRLRRGPVLAALGAAVLLAGGGSWILYGSDWLRVEKVTATGTGVLTPDQVLRAAAVPVGAPLATVDTEEIEARLRGRLPRIESADVVRSWPHGIAIAVTERKPVLLIRKDAKFVEVDASGVRFDTVAKAPAGVPVLELNAANAPSLRRFDEERLLHEAVGIAGAVPAAVARETLRIRVTSYDSVELELSRDRTVVWGSAEQGPAKARALTALLKAAPRAAHFDVSAPTAPSVAGS